jgi:hypothetical protein
VDPFLPGVGVDPQELVDDQCAEGERQGDEDREDGADHDEDVSAQAGEGLADQEDEPTHSSSTSLS